MKVDIVNKLSLVVSCSIQLEVGGKGRRGIVCIFCQMQRNQNVSMARCSTHMHIAEGEGMGGEVSLSVTRN